MAKNPKYYINNTVHFVTSRTEEGLPLVPTHVMNLLIEGILAKATEMYRVKLCDYLFMANHFHMLIVVEDPQHVSAFVGYVKGEIAHAVNKMLGRIRKTIWLEGYDSPIILTPEDVIRYIKYLYLNPIKAKLVESIDEYPGVSSWKMFSNNIHTKKCIKISRDKILPIPHPALSVVEQRELCDHYKAQNSSKVVLKVEPLAWVQCFPGYNVDKEELKERIIKLIHEEEKAYQMKRVSLKETVLGATTLRRQSMLKEHHSKKFSKRMICISSCKDLRHRFIAHFKELCAIARQVYQTWKTGDLRPKIPPGFFPPKIPILYSALLEIY